jgi:hypothetical protein
MHEVGGWQKPTLGDEQVIRDQKKPQFCPKNV